MSNNTKILQLTITCDLQLTDPLTDFLIGVLEASVEVGVDDHLIEHTLHVYVEDTDLSEDQIAEIVKKVEEQAVMLAEIFQVPEPKIVSDILDDQDWGSNWKKHFKPFAITSGLVIKPTWEEYSPKDGESIIEMDPGMAFGTGHHATTSLCMDFIRETLKGKNDAKVLDVGTGTGILAMAAAIFGATDILGIDNDPDAVFAAFENVKHNNLNDAIDIEITALEELSGQYDLVVANIIHDVLLVMKDDLARLTAPGGSIILSGILKELQADNIIRHFSDAGFMFAEKTELGEWAALLMVKK